MYSPCAKLHRFKKGSITMTTRFLRFPGGKSKALTLSYDDGVEQDLRLVSIMRQYGLKGTFNINSGLFPPEDYVHPAGKVHRRMTRSQILSAYPEDMCEVACHTYTHPFLDRCDSAVACGEIIDDRRTLEQLFDRPIHGMAYPFGTTSDTVVDVCRLAGIYYSRTTVSTENFDMPTDWLRLPATCHHKNPRLMELCDLFLNKKVKHGSQLFYLWGHSYEFESDNNWEVIEAFAKKMGGRDDIWYATNMEIYLAQRDFDQLESTADGSRVYNPSIRPVWFENWKHRIFMVPPGESISIK